MMPYREQQQDFQDPLGDLLELGRKFLPDWQCPDLDPKNVDLKKHVDTQARMLAAAEPGDHIAVKSDSGYWHHSIYAGKMTASSFAGYEEFCVIDVWGEDKASSTISVRTVDDFAKGAKGYAIVTYPDAGSLSKVESLNLAKHFCLQALERGFVYDAVTFNCEHFASLCRCLRWESIVQVQEHILHALEKIPSLPVQKPHWGVKNMFPDITKYQK